MLLAATLFLLFQAPPDLSPFAPLLGEWVGEGAGTPGEAKGGFTFSYDLQKRVIVRRNYAEYPAAKDRPAFRHDDLMIYYSEATGGPFRADYYDNEGHVIRYAVTVSGGVVTCVSEPSPSAPRFRFTYTPAGPDVVKIKFEIAPPGKPEAFTPYIEASARRVKKP
jgi:hypothetical protein